MAGSRSPRLSAGDGAVRLGVIASARLHVLQYHEGTRPGEDQGMLFALTKAPQYANLDYADAYGAQLDRGAQRSRKPICAFVIIGRPVGQPGHSPASAEALGRAQAHARRKSSRCCKQAVEGAWPASFRLFLPPLPGSIGGLPVQMVIYSTDDFSRSTMRWRRSRPRRARAGCSSSSTATSTSTSRVNINIDRVQGQRTRHHDAEHRQYAGAPGRRELCQPLQPAGRSYEVIPQVPRVDRLTPESLPLLRAVGRGQQVPLSTLGHRHDDDRAQRADPL